MLRHKNKRKGLLPTTSNTTTTISNNRLNRLHTSQRKSTNSCELKKTSDFIYTSPYELPPNSKPNIHNIILEKSTKGAKIDTPTSLVDERLSEVYSPASVSFKISTTSLHSPVPPPLPERNSTFIRKSVNEQESVENNSRESSPRIITPPPLIDIKSRLQATKNIKSASPSVSKSNSFRHRKNSLESIKSNLSRSNSNPNNLARNLEVLLEVHESSGPTTMTNSTSSKENDGQQEKESVFEIAIFSKEQSDTHSDEPVEPTKTQSSTSSENDRDVEPEHMVIGQVVSAQIHRNNNSALSRRSSNRSSRKSIQVPPPPRRKTLPHPSNVQNFATIQNSNSLPNPGQNSALQQLQALDLFKAVNTEDEVGSEDTNGPEKSICLETDQYVKEISKKRGKLISQIDSTPGDRLRRKVGYEIERRLVKVSYSMKNGYSKKKNNKRRRRSTRYSRNEHYYQGYQNRDRGLHEGGAWEWAKNLFSWLFSRDKEDQLDESDLRRKRRRQRYRRRRRRHRFCFRCVTSSFHALFLYIGRPFTSLSSKLTHSDELNGISTSSSSHNRTTNTGNTTTTLTSRSDNNTSSKTGPFYGADAIHSQLHSRPKSNLSMAATVLTIAESENSRTPTPKMLLDVKTGTLNWPVYQVGGKKGSGMLISTRAIYPAPPDEGLITTHQPGRENFSLVPLEVHNDENGNDETLQRQNLSVIDISGSTGGGGRKLVGWLQVRDPKNKKSFLQVVDPAPKGPFRKAPWHNGNFHVLKL